MMKMMKLSENLSLEEAIKSTTALRLGIDNYPTKEALANLSYLAKYLFQPLRNYFKTAIFISSGYRSPVLNSLIGGSSKSQHCKGEAIDIDMDNKKSVITNSDIFYYIKDNLDFDQLIWEFGNKKTPAWVHVSFTSVNNRKEILKAVKRQGVTKYEKWHEQD